MRQQGIDLKEVFYVRRVIDTVDGNYFKYKITKAICNPKDKVKFHLKIGGIVLAKKKKIEGKKISSCAERFKESNIFGSYVYYCETDFKLRTIVYCRKAGLPEKKFVSAVGVLNNIIPHCDPESDKIITAMTINTSDTYQRKWTRFDGFKSNQEHNGFFELSEDMDYDIFNARFEQNSAKFVGIYITENTSLLMVDNTGEHLYNDLIRDRVYTLFQSGALIIAETTFLFKFYDIEESESFTLKEMYRKKHSMPSTKNFHLISGNNPILFLKPGKNYSMWTLRVTHIVNGERKSILGIPTDGEFQEVFNWKEGIEEVKRRQLLKPWKKYVEIVGKPDMENKFSSINMRKSQAYPD